MVEGLNFSWGHFYLYIHIDHYNKAEELVWLNILISGIGIGIIYNMLWNIILNSQ